MRRSQKPIVIAARRSPLARTQAELIGKRINKLHPKIEVQYRWVESQGDKSVSQSLADQGGKGLFTKDVEQLLLDGEADLAVHSLKDLPAADTTGLILAAVPRRANPCDGFSPRFRLVPSTLPTICPSEWMPSSSAMGITTISSTPRPSPVRPAPRSSVPRRSPALPGLRAYVPRGS